MTEEQYSTATHLLKDIAVYEDVLSVLDNTSGAWTRLRLVFENDEKHYSRDVELPVETCALTPFLNAVKTVYQKALSTVQKEFEEL